MLFSGFQMIRKVHTILYFGKGPQFSRIYVTGLWILNVHHSLLVADNPVNRLDCLQKICDEKSVAWGIVHCVFPLDISLSARKFLARADILIITLFTFHISFTCSLASLHLYEAKTIVICQSEPKHRLGASWGIEMPTYCTQWILVTQI